MDFRGVSLEDCTGTLLKMVITWTRVGVVKMERRRRTFGSVPKVLLIALGDKFERKGKEEKRNQD